MNLDALADLFAVPAPATEATTAAADKPAERGAGGRANSATVAKHDTDTTVRAAGFDERAAAFEDEATRPPAGAGFAAAQTMPARRGDAPLVPGAVVCCGDCTHFLPNPSSPGQGIGQCASGADAEAYVAWRKRPARTAARAVALR